LCVSIQFTLKTKKPSLNCNSEGNFTKNLVTPICTLTTMQRKQTPAATASPAVEMFRNANQTQKNSLNKRESGMSLISECSSTGSSCDSRRESVDFNDESYGNMGSPMVIGSEASSLVSEVSNHFPLHAIKENTNGGSSGEGSPASNANVCAGERRKKRKKKKRLVESLSCSTFKDIYYLTGDVLGEGSYGRVETCINMFTDVEYAVKIISTSNWCFSRSKVLKEIELYYLCQSQPNIIQLVEYFEETDNFYLIFEKAYGGQLLSQIQKRVHFTEVEAASIIRDLAQALEFLHERGIAHRDLKPENILCLSANSPLPIKLCDFDLCSGVHQSITTPLLQSPVGSAEYMAPEVVNAFNICDEFDDDDELTYDKKCDLWSLGIIAYILLCGYLPFAAGKCDQDCGWDRGEECGKCTRSLFNAICNGTLIFHEQYWSSISSEAKDLISKLLVRDASLRLDAGEVLKHPFIVSGGSSAPLETPSMLRRQTSVKEFSDFTTSALAIKRNFETNTSFSKAFRKTSRSGMRRSATSSDFIPSSGTNLNFHFGNQPQQEKGTMRDIIEHVQSDISPKTIDITRGKRRRGKKPSHRKLEPLSFREKYQLTEEQLGEGSSSKVVVCVNNLTGVSVAVKVVQKTPGIFSRSKMLKEIETFYLCEGQDNILQLLEFFEEPTCFYLVFEKMEGGQLLDHIKKRAHFSEKEAARIIRDMARALQFLHKKGIAHRDLKPENVLCVRKDSIHPIKLCDFDLCSNASSQISTPKLQTPVGSLEYMAPEVLSAFQLSESDGSEFEEDEDDNDEYEGFQSGASPSNPHRKVSAHPNRHGYNKKCDLWSLGVIMHILLSGSPPFSGNCGQECGWDNGEACPICQKRLSAAIQEGTLNLDKPFWKSISNPAKDLLMRLLEKDVEARIDTRSLLNHSWITGAGNANMLGTARILRRHASTQELSDFTTSALALNKAISFNEAEDSRLSDRRNVATHNLTKSNSTSIPTGESLSRHQRLCRQNRLIPRDSSREPSSTIGSIDENTLLIWDK
ncbi:hypothetical protein TCAL_01677, partial [Tigriopus californicus]